MSPSRGFQETENRPLSPPCLPGDGEPSPVPFWKENDRRPAKPEGGRFCYPDYTVPGRTACLFFAVSEGPVVTSFVDAL